MCSGMNYILMTFGSIVCSLNSYRCLLLGFSQVVQRTMTTTEFIIFSLTLAAFLLSLPIIQRHSLVPSSPGQKMV